MAQRLRRRSTGRPSSAVATLSMSIRPHPRAPQQRGRRGVGGDGLHAFGAAGDRDAVGPCIKTVEIVRHGFALQSVEEGGGHRDGLDDAALASGASARAGCGSPARRGKERELGGLFGVGLTRGHGEDLALRKGLPALVRLQLEELEQRMRASSWVATKVPRPWRRTSRRAAVISSSALRTVPWLTPRSAAICISDGTISPAFPAAVAMRRVSCSLTCLYNGRNPSFRLRLPARIDRSA